MVRIVFPNINTYGQSKHYHCAEHRYDSAVAQRIDGERNVLEIDPQRSMNKKSDEANTKCWPNMRGRLIFFYLCICNQFYRVARYIYNEWNEF